jgi:hypothetical protein
VSPHETGLQKQLLLASQRDDFLHVGEFHGGRLLEVDMLARFQREQGVCDVVAHLGLHSHDPSALEEFVPRDEFCVQLLARLPPRVGGLADADELPVGRVQGEFDFVRPVRIGRAQEADGNAAWSLGGAERCSGKNCRRGSGS